MELAVDISTEAKAGMMIEVELPMEMAMDAEGAPMLG